MRLVVGISLLLLGIGMLLCRVDGLAARGPAAAEGSAWVRTVDGWERTDCWKIEPAGRPSVHPLVVAAGQGLLSVFALAAFHRDGDARAGGGC